MLGHLGIRRSDNARISISTEIFGGIKAERCGYPERTCAAPIPLGADRLSGIFDKCDSEFRGVLVMRVLFNGAVECVHVGALAIEMNRKYRANVFRMIAPEFFRNELCIEIESPRGDVDKDRLRARPNNLAGRGKEAERSGDD